MNISSIYINLAFIIILIDVLLNYFLTTFYRHFPILAIIPVLLISYIISNPKTVHKIDNYYITFMGLGLVGYMTGIITIDNVAPNRFFQILSAYSAWIAGYLWFTEKNRVGWNSIVIVVLIHSAVCVFALLKIAPNYFPTEDYLWSRGGIIEIRPSVTTDQNIQIFYFLPIFGLVLYYNTTIQLLIALLGLCMSVYTIVTLQSRSGILVIFGCLLFGLLLHLFSSGKRSRAVSLLLTFTLISLAVIIYRYDTIFLIIVRFTEHDYTTAAGRLHGFLYFFEKLMNPWWWIPRGNSDYAIITTGQIPHSNITAQLLQGGIFGVATWISLIVWPTIKIAYIQFHNKLDNSIAIITIISIGSLVAQLSLNIPFFDIIWLYGGLTSGAVHTLKKNKSHQARKIKRS